MKGCVVRTITDTGQCDPVGRLCSFMKGCVSFPHDPLPQLAGFQPLPLCWQIISSLFPKLCSVVLCKHMNAYIHIMYAVVSICKHINLYTQICCCGKLQAHEFIHTQHVCCCGTLQGHEFIHTHVCLVIICKHLNLYIHVYAVVALCKHMNSYKHLYAVVAIYKHEFIHTCLLLWQFART